MQAISLRADVRLAARVEAAEAEWVASPTAGVERVMLERDGGEIALATSIVRYAAGTRFPAHGHETGEEFLVLQGEFCDEHGRYGAGTYVRNPPGSFHEPSSVTGCTLFVKLRQMTEGPRLVLPPSLQVWQSHGHEGQARCVLHAGARCRVSLQRLPAGGSITLGADAAGEELFMLDGSAVCDGHGHPPLRRWSWWRRPAGGGRLSITSPEGAMLWLKRGHLDRRDG